jgi:hypothetical protein
MDSITFFIILIITATIIYLVLYKLSIKIESFANPNPNINNKVDLAFKLGISESRIKNYVESGEITNPGTFEVNFDIYPRTIAQKDQPLIRELDKKLENMKTKNETFKIKSDTSQDVFLSKIEYKTVELSDSSVTSLKAKFVDDSLNSQVKYLEDQKKGMITDLGIEPRLRFVNGEVKEIPLPTYAPTPRPTPRPSSAPRN